MIYFDIGQLSCVFSCGGQITRSFPSSYEKTNTFESFLSDLKVIDIITDLLGDEKANNVLNDMWKYLCNA